MINENTKLNCFKTQIFVLLHSFLQYYFFAKKPNITEDVKLFAILQVQYRE